MGWSAFHILGALALCYYGAGVVVLALVATDDESRQCVRVSCVLFVELVVYLGFLQSEAVYYLLGPEAWVDVLSYASIFQGLLLLLYLAQYGGVLFHWPHMLLEQDREAAQRYVRSLWDSWKWSSAVSAVLRSMRSAARAAPERRKEATGGILRGVSVATFGAAFTAGLIVVTRVLLGGGLRWPLWFYAALVAAVPLTLLLLYGFLTLIGRSR